MTWEATTVIPVTASLQYIATLYCMEKTICGSAFVLPQKKCNNVAAYVLIYNLAYFSATSLKPMDYV